MFTLFFSVHDFLSSLLAKHVIFAKRTLLIIAHLGLFGILFPGLYRNFGQLAFFLLLGLLFLSPLSRMTRMPLLLQLMGFRREIGIMMAYFAIVHGLGYLLDPLWFSLYVEPFLQGRILSIEPRYLFGFVAYLLTLPLLMTSNRWAQQLLGVPRWKHLHRLVYGLFIFVVLHYFLIRGRYRVSDLLQAVTLLSVYGAVKLLAWRNFLSPLADIMAVIGKRYRAYKTERLTARL